MPNYSMWLDVPDPYKREDAPRRYAGKKPQPFLTGWNRDSSPWDLKTHIHGKMIEDQLFQLLLIVQKVQLLSAEIFSGLEKMGISKDITINQASSKKQFLDQLRKVDKAPLTPELIQRILEDIYIIMPIYQNKP